MFLLSITSKKFKQSSMMLIGWLRLCRGSFAVVKLGVPKDGSPNVAIKIVDKKVSAGVVPNEYWFLDEINDDLVLTLEHTAGCRIRRQSDGAGSSNYEESRPSELYQASWGKPLLSAWYELIYRSSWYHRRSNSNSARRRCLSICASHHQIELWIAKLNFGLIL